MTTMRTSRKLVNVAYCIPRLCFFSQLCLMAVSFSNKDFFYFFFFFKLLNTNTFLH